MSNKKTYYDLDKTIEGKQEYICNNFYKKSFGTRCFNELIFCKNSRVYDHYAYCMSCYNKMGQLKEHEQDEIKRKPNNGNNPFDDSD